MNWRHKSDSEIDHELLWLAVSLAAFSSALLWLKFDLPRPVCLFHELTHHACLTCGGTRCLIALMSGHPTEAFLWNPLVFCGFMGIFVFDLYALAVLLFNLPRLRFEHLPPGAVKKIRITVVLAAAANWIYLLWAGV